jgi:hypothetical protein
MLERGDLVRSSEAKLYPEPLGFGRFPTESLDGYPLVMTNIAIENGHL